MRKPEQLRLPTRLYLARHGRSVADVARESSYKRVDPPQTDLGVRPAGIAAEHSPRVRFPPPWATP
jgi:broad specificity phosphatase PhoE